MMKAVWNGAVLAQSEATEIVESNHYFPADSLNREYFVDSEHRSHCGWKGTAHYYSIQVDGARNDNAAWYYPEPYDKAQNIRGYVAFWRGVEILTA